MKITMPDVVEVEQRDAEEVLRYSKAAGVAVGLAIAHVAAERTRGFDHLYPQAKSKLGKLLSDRARMKRLSRLPKIYYKETQLTLKGVI